MVYKKYIETYLGVQVKRDCKAKTLKMHQTAYLNAIVNTMNIMHNDILIHMMQLPQGVNVNEMRVNCMSLTYMNPLLDH